MSNLVFKNKTAKPGNPDSGYFKVYFRNNSLRVLLSNGVEYIYSTGVTVEEVQDILGMSFQDSSSIEWTYNDTFNYLEANVKQELFDSINDTINNHIINNSNPHGVTKTQIGLSNVPNVNAVDRANHTGTQDANTIHNLDDAIGNYLDKHNYEEKTPYSHTASTPDWMFDEVFTIAHTKIYKCTISYIWAINTTSNNFECQLNINNGSLIVDLTNMEPQDAGGNTDGFGTDQAIAHSYTFPIPLTAGSNSFRLEFNAQTNGTRSGMRKASIFLEREQK